MNNLEEQIEKSNFILWYQLATIEEIILAMREHREKFQELVRKYINDTRTQDRK